MVNPEFWVDGDGRNGVLCLFFISIYFSVYESDIKPIM